MGTKSKRLGGSLLWSAALCFASCTATAQGNSPGISPLDKATQDGIRRIEEQDRQQQQRLQPSGTELKADALGRDDDPIPQDSPCFVVDRIDLEGKGASDFQWLLRTARPYLHQCLGSNALRQLLGRMNQRLLASGYTTSKVAPGPQNLRSGNLVLQLELGLVAKIAMVTDTPQGRQPDTHWGGFSNAMPVSPGDVLNVHAIEQGLEQMKRLASQNVSTLIQPGAEPGTSRVELLRNAATWRDRLHGGITLDDSGNSATGRALASGFLVLDNPLGLNDLLNLNASSNLQQANAQHRSQSMGLSYSIPWHYSTVSLNYSHARFAQNVVGTTATFLSSGGSDTGEVRLAHTLWRSGSAKWGAFVAVSGRTADSFINEVELIVQRRRVFNRIVGTHYKHILGETKIDAELSYRHGTTWFGAEDDLLLRDPTGPSLRPRITYASASLTKPLSLTAGKPYDYSAALRFQHTRDKSLSVDQLGIGSRYTVRGFDGAAALLGESGFTLRQELSRQMPNKWPGTDTVGYLALDAGRVWGPSADSARGSKLVGMAIGMRAKRGALSADVTLGTPIYRPSQFASGRLNLNASLSYQF